MLTSDKYVGFYGGNICPNCWNRNNLKYDPIKADGTIAWVNIECKNCRATWRDVYTPIGYKDLVIDNETNF